MSPRKAHVPEADLHPLQSALEHRLDPGVMLHPIRQTVAVNRDGVVLLKRERRGAGGRMEGESDGEQAQKLTSMRWIQSSSE